jgi:site-specific recombinase XerC
VFTTPKGTPLEPSNVLKRFKAVLEGAGLPAQRFHDLRHCAASLMLAQGVPMRVAMDVLGHTQMATTADLYSHVMPVAHREVADLMDAMLGTPAARACGQTGPGICRRASSRVPSVVIWGRLHCRIGTNAREGPI